MTFPNLSADSPIPSTDPRTWDTDTVDRLRKELAHEISAEHYNWARSGGAPATQPDPDAEDGLPPGWRLVAYHPHWWAESGFVLCARNAGGWTVLVRSHDTRRTALLSIDCSLWHLYDSLVWVTEPAGSNHTVIEVHARAWLQAAITSMYDPTNPDEAAEQTMFALSGILYRDPSAASFR